MYDDSSIRCQQRSYSGNGLCSGTVSGPTPATTTTGFIRARCIGTRRFAWRCGADDGRV
jgi:hypothetical protein